jgi:photosynthetic reaction center H subunit
MSDDQDRVVPLAELDDGALGADAPDIRGWAVVSGDDRRVGEVDELLVEPDARTVRYLDVELDEAETGVPGDAHVLIPIGFARLDRDRSLVRVGSVQARDLVTLPRYDQGPVERSLERALLDRMGGGAESGRARFYEGEAFDPGRCFGDRDPAAETIRRLEDDWATRRVGQVGDL